MPQTREHLAICQLLRHRAGLVALTKTDLVEPDWLELVREDVARARCEDLPRGRPIVAGLGEDRGRASPSCAPRCADAGARGAARRAPMQLPRLPIDRVFTIKGFGTVVTGTLVGRAAAPSTTGSRCIPRACQAKVRGAPGPRPAP